MSYNFKKIARVLLVACGILLLLGVFFRMFGWMTKGNSNSMLISQSAILFIVLLTGSLSNKNNFYRYRRRSKASTDHNFPFIAENLGKEIKISTLNQEFRGVLVEVEGEWIKIKASDMRPTVHILKSNMITSIKVVK